MKMLPTAPSPAPPPARLHRERGQLNRDQREGGTLRRPAEREGEGEIEKDGERNRARAREREREIKSTSHVGE